jgi:hypothetical protein
MISDFAFSATSLRTARVTDCFWQARWRSLTKLKSFVGELSSFCLTQGRGGGIADLRTKSDAKAVGRASF